MAINKLNLNGTTYDIGEAAGTNTAESVVEFSSADEENPSSADESVALIKSGDTHKSLLEKISAGMKNIRYLLKQVSELNTSLSDKVSKSGDTMTGNLSLTQSVDSNASIVAVQTTWSDNKSKVSLQVGTGGINRGVYDDTNKKWMMYTDSSDNVHLGTSTIGSGTKPMYLSSGVPTASSSTVGSGTKPVYLSSGTVTASSSTVGSSSQPVYLNGGTLTACSMSSLITIDSVSTDNITISATSNYSFSKSCSKSGYTARAAIGYSISNGSSSGQNSSMCNVFGFWVSSNTAYANIRNTSSSSAVIQVQLWILYTAS